MTNEKVQDGETAKWVDGTVVAVVSGGASLVANAAGADPYTSAGVGVLGGRLTAALFPALRRRYNSVLASIRQPWDGVEDPEAEFWTRVDERESAQEVWYVGAARMRELVDPAVGRSIGALLRQYVEANAFPDAFFRGVAGMFAEMTGEELTELQRFLEQVGKLDVNTARIRAEVQPSVNEHGLHLRFHQIDDDLANLTLQSLLGERFPCTAQTRSVLRLLGHHGLADGGDEANSGLVYIHIDRSVARRVLDVTVVET